jgi:hypothetical protein
VRPALLTLIGLLLLPAPSLADRRGHLETEGLPSYLRDRGEGMPLSMFGTFVQKGQLLVYPFAEFYHDVDFEYKPSDLGHAEEVDYRGEYEASEQLLFLAYGVSDRLAIELEGALIQAELEKSRTDASSLPAEIRTSGVGDVEGQVRWRWARETAKRPEVFSYFETVGPTQPEGSLIGTSDWEFKLGTGLIRGFAWGTLMARAAVEYSRGESTFDTGEFALEYLRRLSPAWRVYAGVEGTQDEVGLVTEAQWHVAPNLFVKANSGFGLTSKATDWAPEAGVVLAF